jgi:oligosaccharide repeat unit polymerase
LANRINNLDFQKTVLAGYGIVNSIFSLFANLFILAIIFSFINFARGVKYKRKAFLLLISSLSYVIYVLAYVGRDGVVYWLMSFLFILFLMKGFLDDSTKRKITRVFYIIALIIIIPFIYISIARFSYGDTSIGWAIANYLGQQVGNFNDLYELQPPLSYGKSIFPLFTEWLDQLGITNADTFTKSQQDFYFYRNGVTTWIFKTYIGSFLSNFGRIGTIIILFSLTIISRGILNKVNRTKSFTISRLIIFILLFQNVLWGVFYFRLALNNIYILVMVFLSLFFNYFLTGTKQSQIIILKFKGI